MLILSINQVIEEIKNAKECVHKISLKSPCSLCIERFKEKGERE